MNSLLPQENATEPTAEIVNLGGRPLKFETPKILQEALVKYFENTDPELWTITGVCLAIGSDKQVLRDYGKRKGFKEIVQRAKLMVENSYEIRLRKKGDAGSIFGLKNFGWVDKQDHTVSRLEEAEKFEFGW